MEFPITELLDKENCTKWVIEYFHPNGFSCPSCKTGIDQAREFWTTKRRQLVVYCCRRCQGTYNLYTRTVFQQHHLTPMKVILLMRGVHKGESSKTLAAELALNYQTVLTLRHQMQANAERYNQRPRLQTLKLKQMKCSRMRAIDFRP